MPSRLKCQQKGAVYSDPVRKSRQGYPALGAGLRQTLGTCAPGALCVFGAVLPSQNCGGGNRLKPAEGARRSSDDPAFYSS
jgi:hypothetical protein